MAIAIEKSEGLFLTSLSLRNFKKMKKLLDKIPVWVQIYGSMALVCGILILAEKYFGKSKTKKYYEDVRKNKIGKQFIYENDSIYITHTILDSVIKDTIRYRDDNGDSIGRPDNDNGREY